MKASDFEWDRGLKDGERLDDQIGDLIMRRWTSQTWSEEKEGETRRSLTSSAESAWSSANAMHLAISPRSPLRPRRQLTKRRRASLPSLPLRVRSRSESSSESVE